MGGFRVPKAGDIMAKLNHGRLVGLIKVHEIKEHPVFDGKILMTYEYLAMSDFIEHVGELMEREFNADGSSIDGGGITHMIVDTSL